MRMALNLLRTKNPFKTMSVFMALLLCKPVGAQTLDTLVAEALDHSWLQLNRSLREIGAPSLHPETTEADGRWKLNGRSSWTSGFVSGFLWYAYALTENPEWRVQAERWTADLESQKYNDGDHDVGFRMMSSWGNGYKLTGRQNNVGVLITTANSLAERYNERIGCIRSWGDKNSTSDFRVIVDNMMNLELLFWAAEHGGDSRLYDIAVSHAEKTLANHVRPDGSTYHVIDYRFDGSIKRKYTHQGFSNESTWSRGQAWGTDGFVMTYRETGDERFLTAAIRLADYFIGHLPADHVPYCDFDSPNIPDESKDASAAAIVCSALFELDCYVDHSMYRDAALDILRSLAAEYLTRGTGLSSILQRGCVRYGSHEQGLIYADYYFLEAISRYLGVELSPIEPVEPEKQIFSDIALFGDIGSYSRLADFAVLFGFIDNDNYNYAMVNSNRGETGNAVFAVRMGVRERIDNVSEPGLLDNDYHDYRFEKTGGRITLTIDGELLYTFEDARLAQSGLAGVGSYNDRVFFDDIFIRRSPAAHVAEPGAPPDAFQLLGNYPNPFNPGTTIAFVLSVPSHVSLRLYDIRGREIAVLLDHFVGAGRHTVGWDARDRNGDPVPAGVYLCTLRAANRRQTVRMLLLK